MNEVSIRIKGSVIEDDLRLALNTGDTVIESPIPGLKDCNWTPAVQKDFNNAMEYINTVLARSKSNEAILPIDVKHVFKRNNISLSRVLCMYPFGSMVYDTHLPGSDCDFIVVHDGECTDHISYGDIDINLYSEDDFRRMLDDNRIDALECMYIPDACIEHITFDVTINLDKLRRSISAICSNSYVKCKKKLADGEDYIGKKSLFHSLRIADYGIQLARFGKIASFTVPISNTLSPNYDSFSDLWIEILCEYTTWEELNDKYKSIANSIRSEFRLLAPLDK